MYQSCLYVSEQSVCIRAVCRYQSSLYVSEQSVCVRAVCMCQISQHVSRIMPLQGTSFFILSHFYQSNQVTISIEYNICQTD